MNLTHLLVVSVILWPLVAAEAMLPATHITAPVFEDTTFCVPLYSEEGERCYVFLDGKLIGSTYVVGERNYCIDIPAGFEDTSLRIVCGGDYMLTVKRDYTALVRALLYVAIVFLSIRFAARLTYYYFRRTLRGSR